MIVIVAPEPSTWLLPLVSQVSKDGPVTIFAPWAHEQSAPRWLPSTLRRALERRRLATPTRLVTVPGFIAVQSLVRLWEKDDVAKRMTARFVLRRAVDAVAARWLPREASMVYAPSCGAENVLAVAAERGQGGTLIEDVPNMRRFHADLDRAARVHPECVFLRRFRAPAAMVARQEAERVLAQRLLVRGAYARDVLLELGVSEARIATLAARVFPARHIEEHRARRYARDHQRVLLAGLASARGGSNEALSALARTRDKRITLLVHAGEGTEPRDLLAHPNVVRASKEERDKLKDVDAVLAPAWCESYPPEIARAHAMGIPVIATRHARGFTPVTREIEPGAALDFGALVSARKGRANAILDDLGGVLGGQ